MHEVRRYFQTRLNVDGRTVCGFVSYHTESSAIRCPERGTFTETLGTRCFSNVKNGCDIKAYYDHDKDKELGSTRAGNLKIRQNDAGLYFELRLNDDELGDDVIQAINDRHIRGCSPAFRVNEETWNNSFRTVLDADLFEISLTPEPAYLGSCAALQSEKRRHKQTRKSNYTGLAVHRPDPQIRLS